MVAASRPPGHPPGTAPLTTRPPWQQKTIAILQARLSIAITRCVAYLGIFAACGPAEQHKGSFWLAVLMGAYAADHVSWLFFRLVDLPRQIATFPIETALTIGTGFLLVSWMPMAGDAGMVAMAFPAFLVVLAAKTAVWWSFRPLVHAD